MPLTGAELIRVAELVALGAQTAKLFSAKTADGEFCRIIDAAKRIEAASRELEEIGRDMERRGPRVT